MRFKRIFGLILSLVTVFNICAYSKDVPTYDYMWANKSPILMRLGEEGIANARINEFLNMLDGEVESIEPTEDTELLKQYFLVIDVRHPCIKMENETNGFMLNTRQTVGNLRRAWFECLRDYLRRIHRCGGHIWGNCHGFPTDGHTPGVPFFRKRYAA